MTNETIYNNSNAEYLKLFERIGLMKNKEESMIAYLELSKFDEKYRYLLPHYIHVNSISKLLEYHENVTRNLFSEN